MINSYEKTIEMLQSQGKFYINLELSRIKKLLDLLNNPQDRIKVIHVAGTNGKGSVCSISANILKNAGYKIGLYTSPHLVEYTERIKIDNIQISKDNFAKYVNEICLIADSNKIDLTEFELITAAAFKYFCDNNVDIAIIETGLGGRYDATNTVKSPLLEVITSISLDHTDRLGDTIEKIAFEKAGIIKQNSTVIVSSSNKGYETIKQIAIEKNASLITPNSKIKLLYENFQNYVIVNDKKYEFSLLGLYQKENLALVFSIINYLQQNKFYIDEIAIENGLKTVVWQARLQYIKEQNLLIDGAHNPDAATELRKSLDLYFPEKKKTYIYSTINTKDYSSIAKILFNADDEIYYVEFNHKNAVSFDEYQKKTTFLRNIKKISLGEVKEILNNKNLKILTGSLYMIGDYLSIK